MYASEQGGFMTCGGGDDALCYDESPPHHKSQPKALSEHDEAQTLQDALDTYAEREGSLADLVLAQQYRAAARRREETKARIKDSLERVDCIIGIHHRYPSLSPQSPISRSPGERYELQDSEMIDETIFQSLAVADEDGLDCQRASSNTIDVIGGMRRKFMHQQALKKINSCMSVMDVDVAVQDALMYIAQVERALADAAVAFDDDDESLKRVNFHLNNCVIDDGCDDGIENV
jgi:hypothetical protein